MALELRWVDRIHTRLMVRYGAAWLNLWNGVDEQLVKADWARELDGMSEAAISYVLNTLPHDRPPATASQFRALAAHRPQYVTPALPSPKADPQRVASIIGGLRDKIARRKPLQWAYDLQAKEAAGERLNERQKAAWREALAEQVDESIGGVFTPIPDEFLPPGMRQQRPEYAEAA